MNAIILSFLLTAVALIATTAFHYETLSLLSRRFAAKSTTRRSLPGMIVVIIGAHLIEIGFYALAYYLAVTTFGLGGFNSGPMTGIFDYYYFAAETYSSLGYGDIYPTGAMRLIAAIEPLNGLLLLTWSGAFLFMLVERVAEE
jgi:Ion channel